MFDTHYDLLTLAYMAKKENINIDSLLEPLNADNVLGVIGNLYFMTQEEMQEELKYPTEINVLEMFKQAKESLESYNLNCKFLYSIEGCDYITDIQELEELSKAGLNSILLVWNNPNKYGSGNRTNNGLTEQGREFIRKAIDLGLGIDLSHANEQTFYDIIEEIKLKQKEGKQVICYASHSNIQTLQNHPRNLNDNQLEKLKEVGGLLGLVAYRDFLINSTDLDELKKAYAEHIKYAVDMLGIDSVMLASDNMYFINKFDTYEEREPVYHYDKMKEEMQEILNLYFSETEVDKIMYKNAEKLYQKLRK